MIVTLIPANATPSCRSAIPRQLIGWLGPSRLHPRCSKRWAATYISVRSNSQRSGSNYSVNRSTYANMTLSFIFLAFAVIVSASVSSTPKPIGPSCVEFTISGETSAANTQITPDGDLNNVTYFKEFAASGFGHVTGSNSYVNITQPYNISARYCEPAIAYPSRSHSIQLLVHGGTYSKDYWSGLGYPGYQPATYSWINYASHIGWPTLSIDSLGVDGSADLDPVNVIQIPLEAAIVNDIILGLKNGHILPRRYQKVVLIGHSFGSVVSNRALNINPQGPAAVVLTGYNANSHGPQPINIPAVAYGPQFALLRPGYSVIPAPGRTAALYGSNGSYDPTLLAIDNLNQRPITVGALATFQLGFSATENFRGPVQVVLGQQDHIFCFDPELGMGNCLGLNSSIALKTAGLFPQASGFNYSIIGNTGHDLNLHYSAPVVHDVVHSWLASEGF